jgi:hypothetical protein
MAYADWSFCSTYNVFSFYTIMAYGLSSIGYRYEHYFWVYTDFYKWSLLSQSGKLALLVNVFADSSFSR